jgi:hypothetical protein
VIDAAEFWQADLLRRARELRRRLKQRVWREASLARLEQLLMVGFYSVRKLLEAKKLSSDVVTCRIACDAYPSTGRRMTRLNWHRLSGFYDFERPAKVSIGVLDLCHEIVHSYVYCPMYDEAGLLSGILAASDRHKARRLLRVQIADVIALFERAGNDDPDTTIMSLNPKTGDYDIVRR